MIQIPGYNISDRFLESCGYTFYRGTDESSDTPVLVKTPSPDNETYRYYADLQHEYMLLKEIESPGVIRIRDIIDFEDKSVLIVEPFEGKLLSELLGEAPLEISESLSIALNLTVTLGELHRRGIIHGNIFPSCLTVDSASGTIKLTDVTHAIVLPPGETELSAVNFYYPGPVYISPEQTGCINRLVDFRSDFYLLGLILYEMLTGKPPFRGDDLTGLIHNHISKKPDIPSGINKNIPGEVSSVVMKLLEKNAENRYQS